MKEIVLNVVHAIEKNIPKEHKFCAIVVPMDECETSQIGIASTLEPEQLIEMLEGLLIRIKEIPLERNQFNENDIKKIDFKKPDYIN